MEHVEYDMIQEYEAFEDDKSFDEYEHSKRSRSNSIIEELDDVDFSGEFADLDGSVSFRFGTKIYKRKHRSVQTN